MCSLFPIRPATSGEARSCAGVQPCSELARLGERLAELERQVTTDCLTGLWNRMHFDQVIDSELDRSLRYRHPVSLILFDIDHFKRINDAHGHLSGDAVLREVALVANATIRSSDGLFRWGGEEFAVLAPSTGYRGAGKLAEQLRDAIARHAFPAAGSLTVSLGVAEHILDEGTPGWFRRADAMLYTAKEAGRNRVRVDARGSSDAWADAYGLAALRLTWQEAYECGEPIIDHQHRELFELANALIAASLEKGDGGEEATSAYRRLLDHVAAHFADEEALLADRHYAGLDAHRRAHAGLLRRARDLDSAYAAGCVGLGGLVEFVAGDVVARHLFKADREFFTHIAEANARPVA